MKKLITLIFTVLSLNQAFAIENGVESNDFPEVVRINTKKLFELDSGSTCTGVLIEKKTILTAKHCVVDRLGLIINKAIVRMNDGSKTTVKSGNFRIHPTADLAILYIDLEASNYADLDFSFVVPKKYIKGMAGAPVTLVGFGGQKLQQMKKIGTNFVFGYDQEQICISMDPSELVHNIDLSSLSLAQRGDSGGPLFLGHNIVSEGKKKLVGIAHAGSEHPYKQMQQTWYENLSYQQAWIQKYINP
jgi:V8-like Glu-specific endopeptidase